MDKEDIPVDKPQLQKYRHSLEKYQRTAILKLNEIISSGIAGRVKQVAVIQVFQCTAFRGLGVFWQFQSKKQPIAYPFDAKKKLKKRQKSP